MKLIIDRTKWLRGEGEGKSFLFRPEDEKMCCLGFYGLACGLSQEELSGIKNPGAPGIIEKFPDWLIQLKPARRWFDQVSEACGSLIIINDKEGIFEKDREKQIQVIFAKNGVEVEFIG